jgi:hypothetical protein
VPPGGGVAALSPVKRIFSVPVARRWHGVALRPMLHFARNLTHKPRATRHQMATLVSGSTGSLNNIAARTDHRQHNPN